MAIDFNSLDFLQESFRFSEIERCKSNGAANSPIDTTFVADELRLHPCSSRSTHKQFKILFCRSPIVPELAESGKEITLWRVL